MANTAEFYKYANGKFFAITGIKGFCGAKYGRWEEFEPEYVKCLNKAIKKSEVLDSKDAFYIELEKEFEIGKDGKKHVFTQKIVFDIPHEKSPYGDRHNKANHVERNLSFGDDSYVACIRIYDAESAHFTLGKRTRKFCYLGHDSEEDCDCYDWKDTVDDIIPHTKASVEVAQKLFTEMIDECDIPSEVKSWAAEFVSTIPDQITLYGAETERLLRYQSYRKTLYDRLNAIEKEIFDDDASCRYSPYARGCRQK